MNLDYQPRPWMKFVLLAAFVCNLAWGTMAVLYPATMLSWMGIAAPGIAILFWQFIGMIVASYGVGFAIAAWSPYRHWAVIFVGLLSKVVGPIGWVLVIGQGAIPKAMLLTIGWVDLVWCVPFGIILWGAARHAHAYDSAHGEPEADDPVRELRTNTGKQLDELARRAPQMVVFLRHAGCTFCRQALADIAASRDQIEATGCEIVFVHLGKEGDDSIDVFRRYQLDDLPRISDPTCRLYRQFGLDLGGFAELFGLRVWMRGLFFGIVNGHGIGAIKGNSFQMPGVYLYHCGVILGGFRHEAASDRPNYLELAQQVDLPERAVVG
ncbi:MAG: redoxin domain-containing protein [Pirellulaceae bacterium]